MLKKLTAMTKYPTAHLRCTMDPEWDVIQVIHRLMGTMKERPKLEWMRSHQDNDPDVDIKKLPEATKLNIKADALAIKELDRLESNLRVPMDPTTEVLLHQGGRTITRDYEVTMRSNIQSLVFKEYYQTRFTWTNSEYGKIDWWIFTPVYQRKRTNT